MNTDVIMLIILGMLIVVLSGALIYLYLRTEKRRKANKARASINLGQKKDVKNRLFFLYRIYRQTPLLNRYLNKVINTYRASTPTDEVSLQKKATWTLTKAVGISLITTILILILGRKDIPYLFVAFLACYIIFTNLVTRTEEKLSLELLDQMDTLITEHGSAYEDTRFVDESLDAILDELPYEIAVHGNIISNILHSPDADLKVDEYIEMAPNKFLLLYTAICATLMEQGDKVLANGRSLFLQSLDYLKEEVGNERLKLRKRAVAFSGKVFAVLIPLLLLKPIEIWAETNMPEIVGVYKGSMGVVMLAIIIILTFISYEVINILKDDYEDEETSNELFEKISKLPICKKYFNAWINKNYTKAQRLQDRIKSVGSKDTVHIFFAKKFSLAAVVFVISIIVGFFAIHEERKEILTNFTEAFTESIVPNEEYKETMRQTALDYKKTIKSYPVSADEIEASINTDLPQMYKTLVATELYERSLEYNEEYYKAYMFILALALSVTSFFVPNWLLKYKQTIRAMARADEVSRFRTLIIILMHQDGMTLDKLFVWLERFSHAFKPSITECLLNLKKDEEQAIRDLRDAESGFPPFRRLCDSLLNADRVGLESAFATLEIDREFESRKRRDDNDANLAKCNSKANLVIFIPIVAATLLYLIVPIVMYAASMWKEMSSLAL